MPFPGVLPIFPVKICLMALLLSATILYCNLYDAVIPSTFKILNGRVEIEKVFIHIIKLVIIIQAFLHVNFVFVVAFFNF